MVKCGSGLLDIKKKLVIAQGQSEDLTWAWALCEKIEVVRWVVRGGRWGRWARGADGSVCAQWKLGDWVDEAAAECSGVFRRVGGDRESE
jgi:hypothetical protein